MTPEFCLGATILIATFLIWLWDWLKGDPPDNDRNSW